MTAASWLLNRYGTYLQHSGNRVEAPTIFEQAFRIDQCNLGGRAP